MKDILNSHPVATLKAEVKKANIKGYSKLKKAEIVDLMMKNKSKFSHIKMAEKKGNVRGKPAPKKKTPSPPKKSPPKKSPPKADNLKTAIGVSREEANKMNFFDLMKLLPQDAKRTIGGEVKKDRVGDFQTGYYYEREKGKRADTQFKYKYPKVIGEPILKDSLFDTRGGYLLKNNKTGKYYAGDGWETNKYGYEIHDSQKWWREMPTTSASKKLKKEADDMYLKIMRGVEAERQKEVKKGNIKEFTGKAEGFTLVKRQFKEADKKQMIKEEKEQSTINKYKPKVKKFLALPLKEQNKLLKNKIVKDGRIGTPNDKGGIDYEPHKHSIQMTKTQVKIKSLKWGDVEKHKHNAWRGEQILAMLMSEYPNDFKI